MKVLITISLLILPSISFAQNIIYDQSEYEGIEIHIEETDVVNNNAHFIILKYSIKNTTDSSRYVLIEEHMGFPLGMTISVVNEKEVSMSEYASLHVLSSQLFSTSQLEDERTILGPSEKIDGKVNLYDMLLLKDDLDILPKGSYQIRILYFSQMSNIIEIDIQ